LSGICPPWFVTFRVDNWGRSFLFPSKCADRETHFLGGKYGKKWTRRAHARRVLLAKNYKPKSIPSRCMQR
jgi:hypothetical protein